MHIVSGNMNMNVSFESRSAMLCSLPPKLHRFPRHYCLCLLSVPLKRTVGSDRFLGKFCRWFTAKSIKSDQLQL